MEMIDHMPSTRELIEAAFADIPYPGDDHIAYHDCEECDDIREFFRGKTWKELRLPELYGWYAAINLLSPKALQYFFPGFMLASLAKWEEADLIPQWILYAWLPGDHEETEKMRNHRTLRQSIFSEAQREAIAAYLREYEEHEGSDSYLRPHFSAAINELSQRRS